MFWNQKTLANVFFIFKIETQVKNTWDEKWSLDSRRHQHLLVRNSLLAHNLSLHQEQLLVLSFYVEKIDKGSRCSDPRQCWATSATLIFPWRRIWTLTCPCSSSLMICLSTFPSWGSCFSTFPSWGSCFYFLNRSSPSTSTSPSLLLLTCFCFSYRETLICLSFCPSETWTKSFKSCSQLKLRLRTLTRIPVSNQVLNLETLFLNTWIATWTFPVPHLSPWTCSCSDPSRPRTWARSMFPHQNYFNKTPLDTHEGRSIF